MTAASSVAAGVHAYAKASSAGLLPQPQPYYVTAASEDAGDDACDIGWRLIQLSAEAGCDSTGRWQQTLTQLLRPAGYTSHPLDFFLAWQLLQVLAAIGVLSGVQQPSSQQVSCRLRRDRVLELDNVAPGLRI